MVRSTLSPRSRIGEAADVGDAGRLQGADPRPRTPDRALRHKARTRTALIEAAQRLPAERHREDMSIKSVMRELDDPAERAAAAVRLTGRLPRSHPPIARILLRVGLRRLVSSEGLAPRARRVLCAGAATGRLRVGDVDMAPAGAGGALLGLMQLLDTGPHLDAGRAADRLAVNLLGMFGLPCEEARALAARPLPAFGGTGGGRIAS